MGSKSGPLDGLKVLEFTRGRAGAIAGMLFAEYGAEVLRIEPPGGDPLWDDLPGYPVWHRGKEIVEIDLALETAGEAILKRLPVTDVLLVALRPGALVRKGLGYEEVASLAPRLVYSSISGFGGAHEGPGYEAVVQSHVGLPSYQGARRAAPEISTYPAASFGAGLLCTIGTLAALHQREQTGFGQLVETSLLDGLLAHLVMTLTQPVDQDVVVPPVSGSAPTLAIYRCGDGQHLQIHLGARGALERLFEVTGLEPSDFVHEETGRHFAGDPEGGERFRAALTAVLEARPRAAWVELFTRADVPVSACLAPGEALLHEQTAALDMAVELRDPMLGRITTVGSPIRFEGTPAPKPEAAVQRGMPRNPEAALRHTGWLTADEVAATEQPKLGAHHGEEQASAPPGREAPAHALHAAAETYEAPLAGLRVLDFGMFAAGPYAAMLLAELGADVVKVEPPSGDTMRPNAQPFSGLHRGKRGLALDLKNPAAKPVVDRLIERADVLLHNFRPGVAERLGLGSQEHRERHPGLIHFHSSGYGTNGPMSTLPGFDQIYQAFCGMAVLQGGEGQPPEQVAGAPLDCLNAMLTAAGILMALHHRDRTGAGQHAECAQLAAGLFALSEVYRTDAEATAAGELSADRRGLAPGYRIEATKDGWLFVCCPDEESRDRLRESLGSLIDWSSRTSSAWSDTLAPLGIAAAPVREAFDGTLLRDRLLADGRAVEVTDPALGRVLQPGGFIRFSAAVLPASKGGPAIGEHSREVLEEAGLAVGELLASGAVVQGGGNS